MYTVRDTVILNVCQIERGENVPFQGSIHLVSGVKMYLEKNFAIPAEAKVSVMLSQKTDGFQNCKLEAVSTSGDSFSKPRP